MLVAPRRIGGGSRSTAAWVAVLALCAGAAPSALVPSTAAGQGTVARVDGEPVPRAELERMVANPLTLAEARRELGVDRPGARELERLALRKVVHRRLMIQEARRRNLEVTDQELDREIAALRRRFEDLRSFGDWMKEQGLDDATLFATVRDDLAVDRLRAALIEDVRVSDDDVRRWYDAHEEELGRGEVRLQIIAVRDEGTAREILAALRSGEDFGRLARERSSGVRAKQGGDTGWVRPDALASPLREAVAILKPGEARGPLRRGSDLLIVRLSDRRRGANGLAQARPEIERRLLAERRQAAVEAWLTEREMRSKIELLEEAGSGAGSPRVDGEAAASASSRRR